MGPDRGRFSRGAREPAPRGGDRGRQGRVLGRGPVLGSPLTALARALPIAPRGLVGCRPYWPTRFYWRGFGGGGQRVTRPRTVKMARLSRSKGRTLPRPGPFPGRALVAGKGADIEKEVRDGDLSLAARPSWPGRSVERVNGLTTCSKRREPFWRFLLEGGPGETFSFPKEKVSPGNQTNDKFDEKA